MIKIKEYTEQFIKNEFLVSVFIFIFGFSLFFFFVNNTILNGWIALATIGGLYLIIGIGIYGIIKPIIVTILKFIKKIIKVSLANKIKLLIRIDK